MGNSNLLGGLKASRTRATFHTLGGRQRATSAPSGPIPHHRAPSGRTPLASLSSLEKALATILGCAVKVHGSGRTDPRTDIYSLGATMYHLMTTKLLFDRENIEDMDEEGRTRKKTEI